MKYSRLGRYLCSSCCWPCYFTFLFLLAASIFHVTAETFKTTTAIKNNNRTQEHLQEQQKVERQQLFLQYNQQRMRKNSEIANKDIYENETAETLSGTIMQSTMDIIDDKFDYKTENSNSNITTNANVNTNNRSSIGSNNNNSEKNKKKDTKHKLISESSSKTSFVKKQQRESNMKSNEKATDFPKAKIIKVTSPTMIKIPATNSFNDETIKLSAAITTSTPISATVTAPTATPAIPTVTSVTTIAKTASTTTTTTVATKEASVVKLVTETSTTTKMSTMTATTKLLPPIAKAYGKIKMSGLEEQEKETNEHSHNDDANNDDDDNDDEDNDSYENVEHGSGNGNGITRNRREILPMESSKSKDDSNISTILLHQQQYPKSETEKLKQQQQNDQKQKQKVQEQKEEEEEKQLRQTTSLATITSTFILHKRTTPSTLLRLMSEEHEHYASLSQPPTPTPASRPQLLSSHTISNKRERRQEPTADEQVDKCRAFESDDNKNVINSPDYPNDYPKNINCTRVIIAPKGQIIRLDFRNSFHIEDKEECKFDYLEIRDGKYGFSNLIGKYCGTDFPPEITSKERYLWLHFHSDESIEYSGFTAVYEFIERSGEKPSTDLNCTIEKSGVEGFVNSSDIPDELKKIAVANKIPLDCMWRIQVNESWKIQLKFLEFKLVKPNDCEENFLDIFPEETIMPLRMKNFCGSAGEGIGSESNVLHIRFYTEATTVNSTFGILFTAFRERGSAPTCAEGELDCQDSTCISDTLFCNDRDNCKFRWDEEPCKKNKKQDSSEILIIIVVFGLILGGMILTFLVNCIRKIMRDQKIIREHIRQSKESKLDELSRHSKGRSRDNISMAMSPRQKHSETSLHILDDVSQRDYYGVAEISVHSNKTLDIRDKEQLQQQQQHHHHKKQQQHQIEREREREHSREKEREHIIMRHDMVVQTSLCEGDTNNEDGDSMATGNDLVTPTPVPMAMPAATYRTDTGCQTRESLFATTLLRQKSIASSGGGSAIISATGRSVNTTPQPQFSTFGYDPTSTMGKPTHAATLRHSIRAPLMPASSIAGSIDSEQLPQTQVAPMATCLHHHRHQIAAEQIPAESTSHEPRFQTQIYAQTQPLTSQQVQHQYPYPHIHQHHHQHQHSHPHQQHQHLHQHQHHTTAQAPATTATPATTTTLPHQHKTKVIIPPLTPVIPTPAPPAVYSNGNNEMGKHTAMVAGSTKPQKQKSDDSKGYIDRNSAPDVIIMTSH